MKRDIKYLSILLGAVLIFIVYNVLTPKPVIWNPTFSHQDKNPFGSYLIGERLPDIFPDQDIEILRQTIYELKDSGLQNLLILSEGISLPEEDIDALLEIVENGSNVFIASQYFKREFADTLQIDLGDNVFNRNVINNSSTNDSASLSFVNHSLSHEKFVYSKANVPVYFSDFDSLNTTIVAVNNLEQPILIKIPMGKGNLFLCSTPLAFTNNYLLDRNNSEFISQALSYLPQNDLVWTEYYQLGRMEAATPLRYFLSSPALKWALYIALISLIVFMIFESKRKQRIIPIITPLKNTTLEFIGTISNLYFQKKDHKSIAEKRINFFLDKIRSHYFLNRQKGDTDFIEQLVNKSGNDHESVKLLFGQIDFIRSREKISERELLSLNKRIDDFKIT